MNAKIALSNNAIFSPGLYNIPVSCGGGIRATFRTVIDVTDAPSPSQTSITRHYRRKLVNPIRDFIDVIKQEEPVVSVTSSLHCYARFPRDKACLS